MRTLPVELSAVFLGLIVGIECSQNDLEVNTPYGTYKGQVIKSRGGRDLLSFKGVPYAQPPVGPLRFKEALNLEKSNGVFEANQDIECLQARMIPMATESKYIGSEDCLYLNIYRPLKVTSEKLPVLVWIHGGSFVSGSGTENWNGPRYLLDKSRNMVIITLNYRLGIFGFLSAKDINLPGNLGLKDQTMALLWVKENIESFGGDPDSITLGGFSAGAASVSHHLNSKASRGLFHRAISHSGTADSSWALASSSKARKVASALISHLGCPFEPNKSLKCLQNLPAEILMNSLDILQVNGTSMVMYLVPVIEKDSPTAFMTKESVARASHVPWITGVTDQEGLLFNQFFAMANPRYVDLSILKENYKTILPVVNYYGPSENQDAITKQLIDFYFGDKGFSAETSKNFVELLSDRMFNYGLRLSAKKYEGKLFTYRFSYRGNVSLTTLRPPGLENGVSHGDDILYLFNTNFGIDADLKGKDLEYSNMLLDMWYSFIKNGDPTPENHLWQESERGEKFLDFTKDGPIMSSHMFEQRMNFLNRLEKDYRLQSRN